VNSDKDSLPLFFVGVTVVLLLHLIHSGAAISSLVAPHLCCKV